MAELEIDSLRHPYESNTEWGLRRCFLEAYQSQFDQRRLLCLASCFVNVECYGCTYPGPLMVELAGLVAGIKDQVDSIRKKVKVERIKPVMFVKSSTTLGEDSEADSRQAGAGQDAGEKEARKPMMFVKATDGMDTEDSAPSEAGAAAVRDGTQEEPPGSLEAIQQALNREASEGQTFGPVAQPGRRGGKAGLGSKTRVQRAPAAGDDHCSRPATFGVLPAGPRKARIQPDPPGMCPPPPKVARLPVEFIPSHTQYSSLAAHAEARKARVQAEYSRMFIRSGQDPSELSAEMQAQLEEKTRFVQRLAEAVVDAEASGKADNSISIMYMAIQRLGLPQPEVTWSAGELGGPQHCTVRLNDVLMARAPGLNKKAAKSLAFDAMLVSLRQEQIRLTANEDGTIFLEPPEVDEEEEEEEGPPEAVVQPVAESSSVEVVEMAVQPEPPVPTYHEPARIVPAEQETFTVDYDAGHFTRRPRRPVKERLGFPMGRGGYTDAPFPARFHSESPAFSGYGPGPAHNARGRGSAHNVRGGRSARGRQKSPREAPPGAVNDLLLIERPHDDNPVSILHSTASFNKITIDYDFREELLLGDTSTRCYLYILGEMLATALALTKASAKSQAAAEALEALRARCFTLYIKQTVDTDEAEVSRDQMVGELTQTIPDSNIGNKLLKKMGWAGGGVGKDGQGIAQPVSMETVINREGLGLQAEKGIQKDFVSTMRTTVLNYARSDSQKDLVFSPEFSKDERALIHKEAQKLGLKTHSHGSGENRFLVVSRKRTPNQLYRHLVECGGETEKYKLIPPLGRQNSNTSWGINQHFINSLKVVDN